MSRRIDPNAAPTPNCTSLRSPRSPRSLRSLRSLKLRQPFQRLDPLRAIDPRAIDGTAECLDGAVVRRPIDREGNAVLAAVRERETCGIAGAGVCAVDQLRCERERAQRFRSDPFNTEQRLEILRSALVRFEQNLREIS